MNDDNLPLDYDGVPLVGPMADFVGKAVAEVVRANIQRMNKTCVVDLKGDKLRAIEARRQAIAEWRAMHDEASANG